MAKADITFTVKAYHVSRTDQDFQYEDADAERTYVALVDMQGLRGEPYVHFSFSSELLAPKPVDLPFSLGETYEVTFRQVEAHVNACQQPTEQDPLRNSARPAVRKARTRRTLVSETSRDLDATDEQRWDKVEAIYRSNTGA